MTSLVDRYVYTALRRVPEHQPADIDRELRALRFRKRIRVVSGRPGSGS